MSARLCQICRTVQRQSYPCLNPAPHHSVTWVRGDTVNTWYPQHWTQLSSWLHTLTTSPPLLFYYQLKM